MEVVVMILVIGGMVALFLPALQKPRINMRRMQCLNNMRNVGLAAHNFAHNRGGNLPALTETYGDAEYGWPVALLGFLDRHDLVGNITPATQKLTISVLTCPEDPHNVRQPGGLSFVANAGYGDFVADPASGVITDVQAAKGAEHDGTHINWNRSTDPEITPEDWEIARNTGVFWRRADDDFQMSLDRISERDGLTQTLMLTENINAGNTRGTGWSSTVTNEIAFVVGAGVRGNLPGWFGGGTAGPLAPNAKHFTRENIGRFSVQSKQAANLRGKSPVPRSPHLGIVNIVFCDGHAGSLSTRVDMSVYVRLISSGGVRNGQMFLRDNEY